MSMADRIAVMSRGEVKQIGTPIELYSNPESTYIADFVGTSNILKGTVIGEENGLTLVQVNGFQILSAAKIDKKEVDIVIRPENIKLVEDGEPHENILDGKILLSTYLGSIVRYDIQVGEYTLLMDTTYQAGDKILPANSNIKVSIHPERVLLI